MSPQRKGIPPKTAAERVQAAVAWRAAAEVEMAAAVVDAMRQGGSIAEVAKLSGLSERTILRWRKGQGLPSAEELRESRRRDDAARSREWFRRVAPEYGITVPDELEE